MMIGPTYAPAGVTLYQGEALAVLLELEDASVDAIVTDPPYSSGGQFRTDRVRPPSEKYEQSGLEAPRPEFSGDNRDQRGYAYWSALWLSEALRVCKPGAPICLFTDWRQLPLTTDLLQAGGWVWRGIVPWDKTEGCRPQLGRFSAQCEYIVWGSAAGMPLERGVGTLPGFIRAGVRQADKFHMAGKPTQVCRALVKICTPGGVVLDPFMGSGTTGVAAIAEGYRFVGIEREAEYCRVAQTRLARAGLDPDAPAPQRVIALEEPFKWTSFEKALEAIK